MKPVTMIFFEIRNRIYGEMDAFYKEHPDTPSVLLKSRLHTLMAKYCEPVIFAQNPFFFEIGMRESQSWGLSTINPTEWLRERIGAKIHAEHPIVCELEQKFEPVFDLSSLGLCSASNCFDIDHHTLGYTTLFSLGLNGLMEKTRLQMYTFEKGSQTYLFCEAVLESCTAVLTIAQKFADRAKQMIPNCQNDKEQHYLKMIAGHNNFVMINDNIIISGLIKSGVDIEDARLYVNGGCQETMIEGFGHTEGVAFYASMPRVMDLFLQGDAPDFVDPLDTANTFEAFYEIFMNALSGFFYKMTDWRNTRQQFRKETTVCPFFSATQTGCIENGKDYSHGGAKYNFSTISLIGLATVTDSLYAIKTLVYEQKQVTLQQFINILSKNWEGHEPLRQIAVSLPKYGHNHKEADALANRFLYDFTDLLRVRKNERGGTYIPSLFVYYHYETFSHCLRATPDGRKDYDLISAGAAPSKLQEIKDVTTPIKSMESIDFTVCGGGSAVLDVKLPLSKSMNATLFTAFIRACGKYHCPTIQPNVVSQEELLDAKINPKKHKNLIVRICGLSAYFVALTPDVQDEIIERNLYNM